MLPVAGGELNLRHGLDQSTANGQGLRRCGAGRVRSGVKAQPGALARRYAKALLEVARQQGSGTLALQVELAAFASLLEANDELRRTLLHAGLGAEARRGVLSSLADAASCSPLLRRLFDVLAAQDRIALLPALATAYAAARNEEAGRVSAEVVSAAPLAVPQRRGLAAALGGALGRTVELEAQVDPAVLGGVCVKVGGRTYDGTVRGRLGALRRRLATGS
jgi:F-type H+-transporting ATPase subunit delta